MLTSSTLRLKDGTELYYKDWGSGQVVVFSHGWPLTSDAFEDQMFFLASKGYRVIAHDRRGHGRSSQPWTGHHFDQYADDLAELMDALNVKEAVHIGHSAGGGEVARYVGRHGSARVTKAVLISPVTPVMVQTEFNPHGVPLTVFDGLRKNMVKNRAQFFKEFPALFFGYNRHGVKASEGLCDSFWLQAMQGSIKAQFDGIKAFSETDFRPDLQKMVMPVLVIHGDDDQVVPFKSCGKATTELLPVAHLRTYHGGSHGIIATHKDDINTDLLAFLRS